MKRRSTRGGGAGLLCFKQLALPLPGGCLSAVFSLFFGPLLGLVVGLLPQSAVAHELLTTREQAWLKAHPVIRIAPDPAFQPIEYFDSDGVLRGLAADYVKKVGEILDINFDIRNVGSWDQSVADMKSRDADMWSAASPTQQRAEYMLFTAPLVEVPAAMIVASGNTERLDTEDLYGKSVVVVSGYAVHDYLIENYPELELQTAPDIETALRRVAFGEADVMVGNLASASHYIKEAGISTLRVAGYTGYVYRLAFAVRSDWPELQGILDKALERIPDTWKQQTEQKWMGMQLVPWYRDQAFLSWLLGIVATLLVLGFLLVTLILKSQVRRRTTDLEHQLQETLRAEEALRIRERAIDSSSVGVVITDAREADNPIIYTNPAFESITGYSSREVIGRNPRFLRGESADQQSFSELREAIAEGKACHVQLDNYRSDGEPFCNELTLSPVRNDNNELTHFIGLQEDVTDARRIQDAMQHISGRLASVTGEKFFSLMVELLAGLLNRHYVLIAEYQQGRPGEESMVTLAVWGKGQLLDNFSYELANSPCEAVMGNHTCLFRDKVRELFPDDKLLQELAVESFLGVPLFSSREDSLGLLACVDSRAIEDGEIETAIMELFATRTAAELERLHVERNLVQAKEESRQYLNIAGVMLIALDTSGHISMINRKGCEVLGYAEQELLGLNWFEVAIPGPQQTRDMSCFREMVGDPDDFEGSHDSLVRTRSGEEKVIKWHTTALRNPDNTIHALLCSGEDVTAQRAADREIRLAASVFDGTSEGIMIADDQFRILRVNRAFTEVMGMAEADVAGRDWSELRTRRYGDEFHDEVRQALAESGNWRGELWNQRADGVAFPVWETISVISGVDGLTTGYISIFSDITEQKISEQKIHKLAHYDTLTELPNRSLFMERCEHAIVRSGREDQRLAVIFLDLDRFKHINDSLGHPVGDEYLRVIASKMLSRIREQDTLARLGGDEFVVLLEDVANAEHAGRVAEKMLRELDEPVAVDGHQLQVSASIGISLFPENGTNVTTLVRNADAAMYRAKSEGRNNYQYYTEELTEQAYSRVLMETALRKAFQDGEFEVHYQPQYALANDRSDEPRLVGAEALLRWRHEERGIILPGEFIELAEEIGLIVPLGDWVLGEACRQMKTWQEQGADLQWISVNIAGKQLQRPGFVSRVAEILEETGLAAPALDLEITETFVMTHVKDTVQVLGDLHELGVTLSIDDFGTGYSSLSYLKQLPFDRLKLDQSFVSDINVDASGETIANAVIALGGSLDLPVVAEGVETADQEAFLDRGGCAYAQGYLYSTALHESEFAQLPGMAASPERVTGTDL